MQLSTMHLWCYTRDMGVRNAVGWGKFLSTFQLLRTKVRGKAHYVRHQSQLFSYSDGTRRPRVNVLICCSKRQKFKSTDIRVTTKPSPCHFLFIENTVCHLQSTSMKLAFSGPFSSFALHISKHNGRTYIISSFSFVCILNTASGESSRKEIACKAFKLVKNLSHEKQTSKTKVYWY